MNASAVGFWGGAAGGLIKLLLDQATFALNISAINVIGEFGKFWGTTSTYLVWLIYIVLTGIVGFLVGQFIPRDLLKSYLSSGLILGGGLWLLMNIFLQFSSVVKPTWAMGTGGLVVNLLTHLILGVIITYSVAMLPQEQVEAQ